MDELAGFVGITSLLTEKRKLQDFVQLYHFHSISLIIRSTSPSTRVALFAVTMP